MLAQVNGFRASSFESTPQGLVALLKTAYSNATGKAGRSKFYRRLYGILRVSSAPMPGDLQIQSTSRSRLSLPVWWEDRGWSFWGQPSHLFISSGPKRSYQGVLSAGTRCGAQAWSRRQRGTCDSNYYYYTGVVIDADVQIPIIRNVFIYITYTNSNNSSRCLYMRAGICGDVPGPIPGQMACCKRCSCAQTRS